MTFPFLNVHKANERYLQDQLIIYMALAKGKSRIKTGPLTLHTTTAIEVTQKITKVRFKFRNKNNTLK